MSRSAAQPDLPLLPRVHEAGFIADLLRLSRLTVLHGAPGAGKTTLLKGEVLRRLGRRVDDRCLVRRHDGVVVPFPERRAVFDRPVEIALYFDGWSDTPLVDLQTRIASALIVRRLRVMPPFPPLAESLAAWSAELGVRFLFVLDRFEQFAAAPRTKPGVAAFDEALIGIVTQPALPVNVLISIRDDALPLLDRYRRRIPGFGDASVRLPPFNRVAARAMPPAPIVTANVLPLARSDAPVSADVANESTASLTSSDDVASRGDGEPVGIDVDVDLLAALREWDESMAREPQSPDEALDVLRQWSLGVAATDEAVPDLPRKPPSAVVVDKSTITTSDVDADGVPAEPHAVSTSTANGEAADPVAVSADPPVTDPPEPAVADDIGSQPRATSMDTDGPDIGSDVRTDEAQAVPAITPVGMSPFRRREPSRSLAAFIAVAAVAGVVYVLATPDPPDVTPTLDANAEPAIRPVSATAVVPPTVAALVPAVAPATANVEPPPAAALPANPGKLIDPNRPRIVVVVDAGNDSDARAAQDLARLVGDDTGVDVEAAVASQTTALPSLAIASFDTLRPPPGERRAAGSSPRDRAILMPLYTEEVHALVRRDSELRHLHDMRGARINLGPAGSGSHATAARLYARMFGALIDRERASALDHREALQRLVTDRSIDVVLVVQAQPIGWLAELPAELRGEVRLLAADADDASTGRATEDYLPTRLRTSHYAWLGGDVPTLATMAFLVAERPALDAASETVVSLAAAICERLPALRREGHPKWREVQPTLHIEGGWVLWPPSRAAIDACQANAGASIVAVPSPPTRGAAR